MARQTRHGTVLQLAPFPCKDSTPQDELDVEEAREHERRRARAAKKAGAKAKDARPASTHAGGEGKGGAYGKLPQKGSRRAQP